MEGVNWMHISGTSLKVNLPSTFKAAFASDKKQMKQMRHHISVHMSSVFCDLSDV